MGGLQVRGLMHPAPSERYHVIHLNVPRGGVARKWFKAERAPRCSCLDLRPHLFDVGGDIPGRPIQDQLCPSFIPLELNGSRARSASSRPSPLPLGWPKLGFRLPLAAFHAQLQPVILIPLSRSINAPSPLLRSLILDLGRRGRRNPWATTWSGRARRLRHLPPEDTTETPRKEIECGENRRVSRSNAEKDPPYPY